MAGVPPDPARRSGTALRRLALDNHTHSPNPLWIAPLGEMADISVF